MATQESLVLVLNVPSHYLKKKVITGRPLWKRLLTKIFPKTLLLRMLDWHESSDTQTMTSSKDNQFYGPPPPVAELTMEQQFKMRQSEDALQKANKEDIITIFLALQRQCFVLGNNMSNLLKNWNKPQDPTTT